MGNMDRTDEDRATGYVPTLGEYATVIAWLAAHPGADVPVHMEKPFKDAMHRAELRATFRRLLAEHDVHLS